MASDGVLLSRIVGGPATCRSALTRALTTLLQASDFARLSERSVWDFATELSELENFGIERSAIRWLLLEEIVEMAVEESTGERPGLEVASAAASKRSFRPAANLCESDGACFVLTDIGERLARELFSVLSEYSCMRPLPQSMTANTNGWQISKPTWFAAIRELRAGATLLKRRRMKAPTQETALCAFEKEGWRRRIDDPLPPRPYVESKHQLWSTIQSLNRGHAESVLHFRAD